MQLQLVDALGDGGVRPRQEARAHAIGDLAEPQIEARRLYLIGSKRRCGTNPTRVGQRRDHVVGQNAFGLDMLESGVAKAGTIASSSGGPLSIPDRRLDGKARRPHDRIYPVVI